MDDNWTFSDADLEEAIRAGGGVADSPVPTQQPDFNVSGSNPNPLAILSAGAAAVTSIAGAVGAVNLAGATAAYNRAAAQQGNALALQQLQTAGKISQLQNATQLAQAQSAYARAAGTVSSVFNGSSLVIVLTVAGLVLAAMALRKK